MNRHPLSFLFAATAALCASSALAQSGVLVGVSRRTGYETLWIVRDAAGPVHATIPDLLVPRADGWWRVGTVPICSTEAVDGQAMDVLWRVRADSTPVISEICHEVPAADIAFAPFGNDSTARDSLENVSVRCSWSHIDIKFVSPDYVAIGERSGQTEQCEPRGGRWYQSYYVSRFNGDSSLALSEFAGMAVDSIGRVALAREAKTLANDEVCEQIVGGFNADEVVEIGAAWHPARARGRWVPVLMEQLGTGDCQLLPMVDVGLASTLTGHDSVQPAWTVLSRQIKGLVDAFSSPRGDLVIARAGDSLLVHLASGAKLGRRVGALPFADREIVMIQWATGRNVARWNEQIAAMIRHGLPAPRVVSPPKDP